MYFQNYDFLLIGLMALGILFGIITARAIMLTGRSSEGRFIISENPLINVIGFLGNVGTVAVIIFGFIHSNWYWPIGLFVMATFVSIFVIGPSNAISIYKASGLLGLIPILISLFMWLSLK